MILLAMPAILLFDLFAIAVSVALLVLLLTALSNAYWFPKLSDFAPDAPAQDLPAASILIPARNEAGNIGTTISSILAQEEGNFELVVLDDNSDDATVAEALAAGHGDARLRIISGCPLPPGWLGKTWACQQLGAQARYPTLIFTDADVQWAPSTLAALLAMQAREEAGLVTIWPTQITESWGERLVVPLMSMAVLAYLPVKLAHLEMIPMAAAANGQCMVFTRTAYESVGGHAAVRSEIVEDVRLAQRIKAHRLRLRMADGDDLIRCRMYHNWPETIDGYTKNILAGHGNSITLLLLSTLFHLGIFVFPWLWLLLGAGWTRLPGWPLWPLALTLAGVAIRMRTAITAHHRRWDALLIPVSVLLMTYIALRAIWWQQRYGGPRWKGRQIRTAQAQTGPEDDATVQAKEQPHG